MERRKDAGVIDEIPAYKDLESVIEARPTSLRSSPDSPR